MKIPALDLLAAIATRIESRTSFDVYDENPQDAPYPYVVMGGIEVRDWSDKFENGTEVYPTIHVWSQYHGRKEADEMADAILQALTSSDLDLAPNFRASLDMLDSYSLMVDLDGKTRHGIIRFKFLIEET